MSISQGMTTRQLEVELAKKNDEIMTRDEMIVQGRNQMGRVNKDIEEFKRQTLSLEKVFTQKHCI